MADYILGRCSGKTLAANSDSLGYSSCCRMNSFHTHSLTPYTPGVTDFLWVTRDYRQEYVGWGENAFQKYFWEEKARHTLKQDPAGSWVDRGYRCTGSFLSCWSTCDLAHSAHSAPDTHQHLATAQGTHSVSNSGQSRPWEQVVWIFEGNGKSPWVNLVAIPKLLQPQNGIRIPGVLFPILLWG